jgi:hypothetical protein
MGIKIKKNMNIESLFSYLKYIGLGILGITGILLILWLGLAVFIMRKTKGFPLIISNFIEAIATNDLKSAYEMTSANYQKRISKQAFTQLIKPHQFRNYKQTLLGIPKTIENSIFEVKVTVVLNSGKEIPTKINLLRKGKLCFVDDFIIRPQENHHEL